MILIDISGHTHKQQIKNVGVGTLMAERFNENMDGIIMDGSMDEKKGKKLGMAQTNLTLCEAEAFHFDHVSKRMDHG
jgi:hypothetical protein